MAIREKEQSEARGLIPVKYESEPALAYALLIKVIKVMPILD